MDTKPLPLTGAAFIIRSGRRDQVHLLVQACTDFLLFNSFGGGTHELFTTAPPRGGPYF
ncbi:hypothetical protein E6C60_0997 [Paenibacillus algicola]|uniref:Uncharacterized protein n=1 Tax=Paenibacillus algicola TaxID=2565926 RepID=A0A4P8XH80_9BACL|nr:hypothetical protein E6C60_0997 [Paenibacillus algicola]